MSCEGHRRGVDVPRQGGKSHNSKEQTSRLRTAVTARADMHVRANCILVQEHKDSHQLSSIGYFSAPIVARFY